MGSERTPGLAFWGGISKRSVDCSLVPTHRLWGRIKRCRSPVTVVEIAGGQRLLFTGACVLRCVLVVPTLRCVAHLRGNPSVSGPQPPFLIPVRYISPMPLHLLPEQGSISITRPCCHTLALVTYINTAAWRYQSVEAAGSWRKISRTSHSPYCAV